MCWLRAGTAGRRIPLRLRLLTARACFPWSVRGLLLPTEHIHLDHFQDEQQFDDDFKLLGFHLHLHNDDNNHVNNNQLVIKHGFHNEHELQLQLQLQLQLDFFDFDVIFNKHCHHI